MIDIETLRGVANGSFGVDPRAIQDFAKECLALVEHLDTNLRQSDGVLVGVDVLAKNAVKAERLHYTMKPIDENTPHDREIVLGCSEYATMWPGRWDVEAGNFMPQCRPDNEAKSTTWEHPTHWCELPSWAI